MVVTIDRSYARVRCWASGTSSIKSGVCDVDCPVLVGCDTRPDGGLWGACETTRGR